MFATSQYSPSRQRSASHSTDDHSKDKPRRFFRRYAHDLSLSSQSLAITGPHHDDLPTPSAPAHTPQVTSAQSTPMTSPSIAHSSILQGSLSSATSESGPQSGFKISIRRVSLFSFFPSHLPAVPIHDRIGYSGVGSTIASQMFLQSALESTIDRTLFSICPHHPYRSRQLSSRRPYANTLTTGCQHQKPPCKTPHPIPSRFSFNSATTPSDSDVSSRLHHVPASGGKWSMTPRKSRPPDLDISGSVGVAMLSPSRTSNPQIDAHRRYASEAVAKIYNARTGSTSGPPMSQESFDVPVRNESPPLLEEGTSQFGPVPPLTPAGAVAEAYKQQELHRDDITNPPKSTMDDRMDAKASRDSGYDLEHLEHSPTPYYTVFGTFSGRRVRAGGPDDRWSRLEAHPLAWGTSQDTPADEASTCDPGARSLTRKVSNRWRKIKGGSVAPEKSPVRGKGHSKGRGSLQELWGGEKTSSRATAPFIDDISNPGDGAWASPTPSHGRSGTGGLRDQVQSEQVVPPVPAIPKRLLKKANQDERHDPLSMLPLIPSSDSHDKDHTQTFTVPKAMADAQPSVATSSSPNSSDVASMQFFPKAPSARSSVSSYGEAIPRLSEISLDQHIITPLEQLRLGDDHARSGRLCTSSMPSARSPRRSVSVPAGLRNTEDRESDRAPLPSPRRLTCSGNSPSSVSSRPSSTSASGSGSARASCQSQGVDPGLSRMEDGIVSLSPPPRAQRSTRRGVGESAASSPSHSIFVKQVEGRVRQMDRTPSARSDMTARVESPEPKRSRDQDTSPRTRGQLTFRELDAPRRPPLSEREKADIWDDLLARSDKAGGTLHINGAAELMSDNMRFSMHSEI
ncbi:hypothetical protein JVU11DRAFT_1072 [Chiua virens]|nr:hypothetical protein JVU11DRAFT_1072 [Chiua virens]